VSRGIEYGSIGHLETGRSGSGVLSNDGTDKEEEGMRECFERKDLCGRK